MKFDFSRYHPLDHRFWECWQRNTSGRIYGRTLVHLEYLFTHRYTIPTPKSLWHVILCQSGHHRWRDEETIMVRKTEHFIPAQCEWCHKPRGER